MEYIEREEAKGWIADWLRNDKYWHPYSKGKNIPTAEVLDMLSLIPAADVQPVKHGRWIQLTQNVEPTALKCSLCGEISCCHGMYCPDCGARMDGEE